MNIKEYLIESKYNIGFAENKLEDIIQGESIKVNWMKHHYHNRWFADPFILDVTDDYYIVLVEEWYDPIRKGRISKLTIDRHNYTLIQLKIVLELDSHLSFPFILREKDCIYIIPENAAAGKLTKYKYNSETDEITFDSVICHDIVTDSVLFNINGEELMLSTNHPDTNGRFLRLYKKGNDGTFSLYDTYQFKENISRMAGDLFSSNGKLYRPAQVCINSYGDAISIQEVLYNNGKFVFEELRRIYSPSKKYDLGFHTFNVYHEHIVVDGLGFKRPLLSHTFKFLWNLIK